MGSDEESPKPDVASGENVLFDTRQIPKVSIKVDHDANRLIWLQNLASARHDRVADGVEHHAKVH